MQNRHLKTKKGLKLHKETVRTLQARDLSDVAGGFPFKTNGPCDNSINSTCGRWSCLPRCFWGH
jgi:hypothetical protein